MSRAPDPSSPSAAARGKPDAAPFSPPAAIPPPEPSDRSSPPVDASDAAAAAHRTAESEDRGNGGNAAGARGKKPAWNVPANGASEVGAVMGADSWPALSESASRASARSSSSDSLKALSDGSIPAPPLNLNTNNTQKPPSSSMKRGGGGGASSSSVNHGSEAPQQPNFSDKGQQSFNKGNSNSGDEFMPQQPQLQSGSNHRRGGYSGNRRGSNSGGAGGSSHHGRYGSRRDLERGGYGWNSPRGFSGRDPHMSMPLPQQQGPSRPFIRPPPPPPPMAPYLGMPPHIRPFVSPMGYQEVHSSLYYLPPLPPLDTLRSMPFIAHRVPPVAPPPMFVSPADHQRFMLVKQIEYYFSADNLCKDTFLKRNMDDQGWVPISLIAGFNRVRQLTNDIPFMLDVLQGSAVVELQGEKIRRRGDWRKWILPPIRNQYNSASGLQSPQTPGYDSVTVHMHVFGLEGSGQHSTGQTHNEALSSRSASGSSNNQMQDALAEDGTSQSPLQ